VSPQPITSGTFPENAPGKSRYRIRQVTPGYFLGWPIRFALKYRRTEGVRALAGQKRIRRLGGN
jgi:hypothetical protein